MAFVLVSLMAFVLVLLLMTPMASLMAFVLVLLMMAPMASLMAFVLVSLMALSRAEPPGSGPGPKPPSSLRLCRRC